MNKAQLVALLRQLSECIEGSTAEDVEALAAGRKRLQIVSPVRPDSKRRTPNSSPDVSAIAGALRSARTRADGERLLTERDLTKRELEVLARTFDLHVTKEDTAERLRQKIIQASIGARLASQAVRGTN